MGKHPALEELEYLFEKRTDFQLSDKEYEAKTGTCLPKDRNYLKNSSALARWAKERGYFIADVLERPVIEKVVVFKRKEG